MGYTGNTGSPGANDSSVALGPDRQFNLYFEQTPDVNALNRRLDDLLADADAGLTRSLDIAEYDGGPSYGDMRADVSPDEVTGLDNDDVTDQYRLGRQFGLTDEDFDDEDDYDSFGRAA